MTTALANQASVKKVVKAFFEHRRAAVTGVPRGGGRRGYRYWTDGREIQIWNNPVAWWDNSRIVLTDAGWRTLITKQMLNAVLREAYARGVTNREFVIGSERGYWKISEHHGDHFWGPVGPWYTTMVLTQNDLKPGIGAEIAGPSPYVRRRRVFPRYAPPPPEPPHLFENKRRTQPSRRVLKNLHTQEEHDHAQAALTRAYTYAVDAFFENQERRYYHYLGVLAGIAGIAERERSRWAKSVYKKAVSYIRKLKQLDPDVPIG